ncbi:MAG TPA: lysophospholipid acyltransferase family protein [Blastocatellia bacterium]|nr:lysophospholipid acyltransferase family protein [Blastocatellia bacterium]
MRRNGLALKIIIWVVPFIYNNYMRLVFYTSRKTYINFERLWSSLANGENAIGAVYHQDSIVSPFTYRGRKIVTMASASKDGEIVSQVLERCGFIPVRGSSSHGGAAALKAIINYMQTHTGVLTGITVDGPRGPARKVKHGIVVIARSTGSPIYILRAWAKPKFLFKNWDRTLMPLPFSRLVFICGDPILIPSDVDDETLEQYRERLEREMLEMTIRVESFFTKPVAQVDFQRP